MMHEQISSGSTLRGAEIVCVGSQDWETELLTNQHHLMARLARTNRILFVESLGLRRPQLARRDLRRLVRRARAGMSGVRAAGEMHVFSPLTLPAHGYRATRRLNAWLLRRQVGAAVRRLGMRHPILWAYSPQAEVLVDLLQPSLVVYHCVDDLAAHKGVHAESFRAAEARYARHADRIFASAAPLAARMRRLSDRVVDAPNVADVEFFGKAAGPGPVDPAMLELPGPRIVFTGALVTTKLDVDFLVALARLRPAWSFALVGPVGLGDPASDVSALRCEPNIHLLGARHYQDLPEVLRGADAALIPYAINPLTSSVFPMKVYEYLAAGLPVVTTRLPALLEVEGLTLVSGAREAAAQLERHLATPREVLRVAQRRAADGHSWDERLAQIGAEIADARGQRSAPNWSSGDLVVDLQNA